jgi:hypothetical protein
MLDGQYSDSVRIVAFNTAKGWSRDVSAEIADEIAQRCAMDGFDVPPFVERFVEWHCNGGPRQLPLPFSGAA